MPNCGHWRWEERCWLVLHYLEMHSVIVVNSSAYCNKCIEKRFLKQSNLCKQFRDSKENNVRYEAQKQMIFKISSGQRLDLSTLKVPDGIVETAKFAEKTLLLSRKYGWNIKRLIKMALIFSWCYISSKFHIFRQIENIKIQLFYILSHRKWKPYLKIAINMLISRMLATKRKNVIRIGGIQWPGTQFGDEEFLANIEIGLPSSRCWSHAENVDRDHLVSEQNWIIMITMGINWLQWKFFNELI